MGMGGGGGRGAQHQQDPATRCDFLPEVRETCTDPLANSPFFARHAALSPEILNPEPSTLNPKP